MTTPPRSAEVERATKETEIRLKVSLDGSGAAQVETGIGFLDHMLELLARHSRIDLDVKASGDLETGAHHTTEDVGICLGQALDKALGDRGGISRYGDAMVPMDEALGGCAIVISGRPYCSFDSAVAPTSIAGFDTELVEEFFRAVANNAKLTVHLRALEGTNAHHKIEACFKAFARALRQAIAFDEREPGIPSTKGIL